MKKVKITADLEIVSEGELITVTSDADSVNIGISSSSAVIFPLKTYLRFIKYINLSKNIDQRINVTISGRHIVKIHDGEIYYLQKWWIFQLLLKSLFK
jgi:hypothetical protein